jgi:acetyl esterase/lipase
MLTLVLDVPVLTRVVTRVTREPCAESLEIEGVQAELVRPAGTGPWPAFVFVTGAHPLRRSEPIVQRAAQGFARAGFVVLVPDLPGLGEGEITPRTLESTIRVVEWILRREDVKGGRVALCGASAGASLALLVAERRQFASSVSLVASVCPFADLENMICLATTRRYEEGGQLARYDAAILLRRVVARSMLAALPPSR